MNRSKRILSVMLTVTMLLSLMTGVFTVQAAEALPTATLLVDDNFAGKAAGTAVSATVAGKTYNGVMGSTAFATVQAAVAASKEGNTILVAAGEYTGNVAIPHNLTLIGNQKDVSPNDATNLKNRSAVRSAANVANESVLKNCFVGYDNFGKLDKDGMAITQSGDVTINGFMFTGESAIVLTSSATQEAIVEISNNIMNVALGETFDNTYKSTNYTTRAAIQMNDLTSIGTMLEKVVVKNNRVEKVDGISAVGLRVSFTKLLNVENNYLGNTTGQAMQINSVSGTTKVAGNYLQNASSSQIANGFAGEIVVENNTFETVGGNNATAAAALSINSDGSQSYRVWKEGTKFIVRANKFLDCGRAMQVFARKNDGGQGTVNDAPFGFEAYDNYFVPIKVSDCKFIHFSYMTAAYQPVIKNNYTAGVSAMDMVLVQSSDMGAACSFGPYYLDKDMRIPSSAMDLQGCITPAGAVIQPAPYATLSVSVPNEISEQVITLKPAAGTSYELFSDADCLIPLVDDTLPLTVGANICYAKVTMGEYTIVYTITIIRKAAFSLPTPAGIMVVNTSFSTYPSGSVVYQEIDGQMYRATIGLSAFSSISEAIANTVAGDVIRVAPGVYENPIYITCPVEILGPKQGINPNAADWSLNPARANMAEEAVLKGIVYVDVGGNNVNIDGFTLTEGGGFRSEFVGIKSHDVAVRNCRQFNVNSGLVTHGFFYKINSMALEGLVLDQNRIEGITTTTCCISAISNSLIKGNAFINCVGQVWMGSTMGGTSSTISYIDNAFINCSAGGLIAASENAYGSNANSNFYIKGNYFYKCMGNSKISLVGLTNGMKVDVLENTFEECGGSNLFSARMFSSATIPADIKINRNTFDANSLGTVASMDFKGTVDVSKNYYPDGRAPRASDYAGDTTYAMYPYYSDPAMTTLVGAAEITELLAPTGGVFNAEEKTISFANTPSEQVDLQVDVSSGASWAIYKDEACTEKIDGTVIRLTGSVTKAYIKVENTVGGASNIYTVTITNPTNFRADLYGFETGEDIEFTTTDGVAYEAIVPNNSADLKLQPLTSYGAVTEVFADAALSKPLDYREIFVPLGTSTFYVKVVSEDSSNTMVYSVRLTRGISSATELREVKNADTNAWDGAMLVASFPYTTESVLPELKVSGGATYKLYNDIGGNLPIDMTTPIALQLGDNIVYVKVIAENGTTEQIYKMNLVRLNRSGAKDILASSIPEYTRVISNIDNRIDVFLEDFLSTIRINLNVSDGAVYAIYKNYDSVTGECSGAISRMDAVEDITLTQGMNVFYVRVTAADNSSKVLVLTIHNEIMSMDANIESVVGNKKAEWLDEKTLFIPAESTDKAVTLSLSRKASAKLYADAACKVELEATNVAEKDAAGQTIYKLNFSLSSRMRYITYYVTVKSQVGNSETYKVIVQKAGDVASSEISDIATHWAAESIVTAYDLGIASGSEKNGKVVFEPDGKATREQMATFLMSLTGINPQMYTGNLPFKDSAKVSSWAKEFVLAAYKLGFMQGDTDGSFRPKDTISRQEFMVVMAKVCKLDTVAAASQNLNVFSDSAKTASWAVPYVKACVKAGLISGNADGTLNPLGKVTRAEIAAVMVRCYKSVRG